MTDVVSTVGFLYDWGVTIQYISKGSVKNGHGHLFGSPLKQGTLNGDTDECVSYGHPFYTSIDLCRKIVDTYTI